MFNVLFIAYAVRIIHWIFLPLNVDVQYLLNLETDNTLLTLAEFI